MDIEQYNPKKPNFLLIVIVSGVAILVIFVLAYIFVDFEGGHIHFRSHPHPTSRIDMQSSPGSDAA